MGLPHYWTPEEAQKIIAAAEPGLPRLYLLLVWRTGMRREEAVELCWGDLFEQDGLPMVRVYEGKGDKPRVIPIHPELLSALSVTKHGRGKDKVFGFSVRTASRIFEAALAEAQKSGGLVPRGTLKTGPGVHSLRHSAARHWLGSGRPVNQVAAWLGHKSPLVTMRTYLPLAPGELSHMEGIA